VSEEASATQEAAVLVPIHRDQDGDLRVVLIRRTDHGAHAGQIAFPGGRREPDDADTLATALREAQEEIGLEPSDVRVIATLPVVSTLSTGFTIAPFLVAIQRPARWRPDPVEVAEVLDVKLTDLERLEARGESLEQFSGWPEPRRIPFVRIGGHRLWGATHRILMPLIPRLLAGEWPLT
jgi:8-oxo-dGTP pyrophosphatase MutT (NUDIX family)